VLIVSGAAVAVGGAVLVAIGQSHRSAIEDAPVGTRWSDVEGNEDADTFTGLGVAGLVAGAACAGIGIALALSDDERPAMSVRLAPAALHVRGFL
jgi:hypothetical protein